MPPDGVPPAPSPWRFVPPLYFQQGAQYFLIQAATTTFLKKMEASLSAIGYASTLITLPFQLKALWSPLVELYGTRRRWTLAAQAAVACGALLLAWAPVSDAWLLWTLVACSVIALAGATHDVAADGSYLLALDAADQARFVGVRNACFRLGRLFVLGFVVWLAGTLERERGVIATAWRDAFLAAAAAYVAGFLLCAWLLPRPASDRPLSRTAVAGAPPFVAQFVAYFRQPRIGAVIAFIFLYRAGESLLMPMLSPFLLEERTLGGLGLSTDQQGLAYGTLGVLALVLGGLLGGWMLGRFGLRRCLWPMALTMHAPNLLLLWAAHAQPEPTVVFALVGAEQLAYGFGFSAYMVFLMDLSRGSEFSTSHYAISTGLMGLAAMLAGLWSGDMVEAVGFDGFFLVVTLAALPGLLVLPFVPLSARAESSAR